MVSRSSKIDVTEDLWQEVVSAWLEKPTIKYVAEEVGIPKSLARRMIHEGVPELGHTPLVGHTSRDRARTNGKRKRRMAIGIETVRKPRSVSRSQSARTVIAQQEAEEYTSAIRERLDDLRSEAADTGVKAVLEESIQQVDGSKEGLEQAERRLAHERDRLAHVTDAAIESDRAQATALGLATSRMLTKQVMAATTIFSKITEDMLAKVAAGEIELPQMVTPKTLAGFVASLDKLASAADRILKLQNVFDTPSGDDDGDGARPGDELRERISVIFEDATDDEIEAVATTGVIPARLRHG